MSRQSRQATALCESFLNVANVWHSKCQIWSQTNFWLHHFGRCLMQIYWHLFRFNGCTKADGPMRIETNAGVMRNGVLLISLNYAFHSYYWHEHTHDGSHSHCIGRNTIFYLVIEKWYKYFSADCGEKTKPYGRKRKTKKKKIVESLVLFTFDVRQSNLKAVQIAIDKQIQHKIYSIWTKNNNKLLVHNFRAKKKIISVTHHSWIGVTETTSRACHLLHSSRFHWINKIFN